MRARRIKGCHVQFLGRTESFQINPAATFRVFNFVDPRTLPITETSQLTHHHEHNPHSSTFLHLSVCLSHYQLSVAIFPNTVAVRVSCAPELVVFPCLRCLCNHCCPFYRGLGLIPGVADVVREGDRRRGFLRFVGLGEPWRGTGAYWLAGR